MMLHIKGWAFYFHKRRVSNFPYMSLCKTSDLWDGAIFDSRAIICILLIKVHKMKLQTKYQRPGPSSFRQKDFLSFAYRNLCKET